MIVLNLKDLANYFYISREVPLAKYFADFSDAYKPLVASLLLVAMPGAPSSFLFLVVRAGAPSSTPRPKRPKSDPRVAGADRCILTLLRSFTREGYHKFVIVEPSYAFSKCEIGFKVAILYIEFKRLDTDT